MQKFLQRDVLCFGKVMAQVWTSSRSDSVGEFLEEPKLAKAAWELPSIYPLSLQGLVLYRANPEAYPGDAVFKTPCVFKEKDFP